MVRIHLKFIQNHIGPQTVSKFENNDFDVTDTSLYLLWKKLKEHCDPEKSVVFSDCNTEESEERQLNISHTTLSEDLENDSVGDPQGNEGNTQELDENVASFQKNLQQLQSQNNSKSNTSKDNSNNEPTTTIHNSSPVPYASDNQMPSPFKDVFILPDSKLKEVKKRQLRELIPSVISGNKGKEYFKKKEEEKNRKEKEKEEKKRKRMENKLLKEQKIQEKKKEN